MRLIAAFEAAKGALVLIAGCGLLALMHRDVAAIGLSLMAHLHLNPASRYPRIFLDALDSLQNVRLQFLALGAAAYACLRFAEAFGLWFRRAWAEWLGVVSGAIYVPFETVALAHGVTALKLATFVANLAIVAYLARELRNRQRAVEARSI